MCTSLVSSFIRNDRAKCRRLTSRLMPCGTLWSPLRIAWYSDQRNATVAPYRFAGFGLAHGIRAMTCNAARPPNKRLKLTGDYRLKGIGVFVPWRAGRPQLKRDPLGRRVTGVHNELRRGPMGRPARPAASALHVASAVVVCACAQARAPASPAPTALSPAQSPAGRWEGEARTPGSPPVLVTITLDSASAGWHGEAPRRQRGSSQKLHGSKHRGCSWPAWATRSPWRRTPTPIRPG